MTESTQSIIVPAQIRAARGLVGWSQQDLAKKTGISRRSIMAIETSSAAARASTLKCIEQVFDEAGVEFLNEGSRIGVLLQQ
ncbi:helix-turn-helix transcriptional regulator [Pelagibacterium sp.]|uniref:helix-turn-helix transcriptional regulator n=1 Tax=Pelagibacterium sp. TaxID=1967288 RepID=UPI003A940959